MSDIYLAIALLGTFGAIVLVGFAVESSVTDRRRAVRMLESQVGQVVGGSTNLREQELQQSFGRRVLIPLVAGAGRVARRITPLDTSSRLSRKLLLAGSPQGWDAERVAAFKVIGLVAGIAGGVFVVTLVNVSSLAKLVIIGLLTFAGFFAPDAILDRQVADRQREIRRSLPDVLDLLTISVEAGLSLNSALAQVVRNTGGILAQEFSRMLQEVQLGVSRQEAFRHLGNRTDLEELNGFVLAMIQADIFGISIANVLRTQSKDLRLKRRQRAEREAQRTPVKIVFPLILCILPSLFIVVIGPGAIRIFQAFFIG